MRTHLNTYMYIYGYISVLGKRLGKSMGMVSKEVKAMSQEDILAFEKSGEITVGTHCLKLTDIKVLSLSLFKLSSLNFLSFPF